MSTIFCPKINFKPPEVWRLLDILRNEFEVSPVHHPKPETLNYPKLYL